MNLADGVLVLLTGVIQTPKTVFIVDSDGEPGQERPRESVNSAVYDCGETGENITATSPLLVTCQATVPTS